MTESPLPSPSVEPTEAASPTETPTLPALTEPPLSTPNAEPTDTLTPTAEPTAAPTELPTPAPTDSTGGGGTGGLPPDSFPGSIPQPAQLGYDPTVVGQSLLLALLFLLLAAFPSQLLNKTLEEHHEEVSGWFAFGGRLGARIRDALSRFWRRRSGLILFVVLSAVLYGFLSPQFGPTIESLASLIGILIGLAIVITAFEIPLLFFYRRMLNDRGRLQVQPLTIFVGIACVAISRIADFQPGYLYGLVVGYVFAQSLPIREEGRANALTAVWMLAISLVAWLALPLAESTFAAQPLLELAVAAGLATIFIGGLEGLLFELVPLRFLRGETVFAWHRGLWAILFLAAAFTFAHILLTPATGYLGSTRTSPLLAAVILFVTFGLFSVTFWAYFRFRSPPTVTA